MNTCEISNQKRKSSLSAGLCFAIAMTLGNYLELHRDILIEVEHIRDKTKFTQKKYDEIIQHAIQQFSKNERWVKIKFISEQLYEY